jgi:hypothetical protein
MWVILQTLGWNRRTATFSWYRIAVQLAMDRGGIVRSGNSLLRSGILFLDRDEIGIQADATVWSHLTTPARNNEAMVGISDDGSHRKPMTLVSESDVRSHRFSVE